MRAVKTIEVPLTSGISDIIGRDASEFLKRSPVLETPEEKEAQRIDFYNRGIKFFTSIVRVDRYFKG